MLLRPVYPKFPLRGYAMAFLKHGQAHIRLTRSFAVIVLARQRASV